MKQSYQTSPKSQEKEKKTLIARAKLYNRSRKKCRVSLKRPYVHKSVHRLLPQILQGLDSNTIRILDLIFKAETNPEFSCVAYSQSTIAAKLELSRDTVSEKLRLLAGLNFIKSNYRHFTSCVYVLSNIFFMKNYRSTLKKFLPSLVLMLSMAYSDTTKSLSSSSSLSLLVNIKNRSRSYVREAYPTKYLVDSFKSAILELQYTLPVCLSESGGSNSLVKVARRKYMEAKFKKLHNAINNITEIDLSLYGKCKLTIFSPEAIQSARWNIREAILRKSPISDPFKHFFSLCESSSLKRGEAIAYETFSMLNRKHKFLTDSDPLNSKKLSAKKITYNQRPSYKRYQSPEKERPQSIQELKEEYNNVINNESLQKTWAIYPAIKDAWLAAFDKKMAIAKESEHCE